VVGKSGMAELPQIKPLAQVPARLRAASALRRSNRWMRFLNRARADRQILDIEKFAFVLTFSFGPEALHQLHLLNGPAASVFIRNLDRFVIVFAAAETETKA